MACNRGGLIMQVNEETRGAMYKLRQTWNGIFTDKKLYAVDFRVNQIDPAWPITAPPPMKASIHVNPKFISKVNIVGLWSSMCFADVNVYVVMFITVTAVPALLTYLRARSR